MNFAFDENGSPNTLNQSIVVNPSNGDKKWKIILLYVFILAGVRWCYTV